MKKSGWLSRAMPALIVLLLPISDSQQAPAQSQPTPSNEADSLPRSKDGNIIVVVVDLLYAAQDSSLQADFKGQTIEIVGQLMPETPNTAIGNHFKLMRMFMTDDLGPRPIAVLVESATKPQGAEKSWIKVVGTVEFRVQDGRKTAVVKASKIEAVKPPEETMLY